MEQKENTAVCSRLKKYKKKHIEYIAYLGLVIIFYGSQLKLDSSLLSEILLLCLSARFFP